MRLAELGHAPGLRACFGEVAVSARADGIVGRGAVVGAHAHAQAAYGTKLAVALGGGGAYPVHVDNACVEEVLSSGRLKWDDARAFTLILYLNPGHHTDHGGQLRLWPTPKRGDAVSAPQPVLLLPTLPAGAAAADAAGRCCCRSVVWVACGWCRPSLFPQPPTLTHTPTHTCTRTSHRQDASAMTQNTRGHAGLHAQSPAAPPLPLAAQHGR